MTALVDARIDPTIDPVARPELRALFERAHDDPASPAFVERMLADFSDLELAFALRLPRATELL